MNIVSLLKIIGVFVFPALFIAIYAYMNKEELLQRWQQRRKKD